MSIILANSHSNIFIFCFISPVEFDPYEIAWYKLQPGTPNTWIRLFRYKVKDAQRETSLLYELHTYSDNDFFKFFRSRARFRAYEKAYFGDYFAPLHVLEIDKMELRDLGTYRVTVKNLNSGAWSERMIELRHEGKCWDRVGFQGLFIGTLVPSEETFSELISVVIYWYAHV